MWQMRSGYQSLGYLCPFKNGNVAPPDWMPGALFGISGLTGMYFGGKFRHFQKETGGNNLILPEPNDFGFSAVEHDGYKKFRLSAGKHQNPALHSQK